MFLFGPTLGLPLPTSKSLGLLLWAHSGPTRAYLGPTIANGQIIRLIALGLLGPTFIGFIALGLLGPTLGLLLPTGKSLCLLLWAYWGPTFANEQIIGFIALGLPGSTLSLRAFANEQIIGFIAVGILGPTLGLPLPMSK